MLLPAVHLLLTGQQQGDRCGSFQPCGTRPARNQQKCITQEIILLSSQTQTFFLRLTAPQVQRKVVYNFHRSLDGEVTQLTVGKRDRLSSPGLKRFTQNIHKRLPKQRCSSHFARPEENKKYYIHFLALALTLTLTFNHLANEPLQPTTMLSSLMYLACGSTTEHNKVHNRL